MEKKEKILLNLLRSGIYKGEINSPAFSSLSEGEWELVYELATQQGVVALAGEGLQIIPIELLPPRLLLLEWIGQNTMQENTYAVQRERVNELRELWSSHGIKCVELKGEAVGRWYKKPASRYSCDFDCYLSDYDKGNDIIEQQGIAVNTDYYKNSSFYWKELYVENHKYCTPIRGKKNMKDLERKLQQLLSDYPEYPDENFNALFLMEHAWSHFLEHAISLKHVCDWAVFRKACGDKVDWKNYEKQAKDCGFWKFSVAFNHIADLLDGVISEEQLSDGEKRLLDSVLHVEMKGSLNEGWKTRVNLFNSYIKYGWKYREFSNHSLVITLSRLVWAFFFDRHPHL